MKKTVMVSILLLAVVAFTVLPMATTSAAYTPKSLKYDVCPVKESFAEAAETDAVGEPLEDPTPFWVDIVNAEYYGGAKDIYVAVLDTGLLANWQFFFPLATVEAQWGRGWSYDVAWNKKTKDFDWAPNPNRGFITNAVGSGHGTHVTSTIAGYRFSTATADMWIRGVAPNVHIIPVLVLDYWWLRCPDPNYPGYHDGYVRFGGGDDWMIGSGIRYIADLAESEGIKIIINMSLGGSEPTTEIEEAIDYAIAHGVIVVAAAGNVGMDGMDYPGAYPQIISAAAGGWTEQWLTRPPQSRWWLNDVPEELNTRDYWGNNWQMYLEEFSGRPNADLGQDWKDLDVCTPGASVVGPYKGSIYWDEIAMAWVNPGIGYSYVWGTSMASPHVAGIAALVAQEYRYFNQVEMEWVLKKAATGLPLASDGCTMLDPWGLWVYKWEDHDGGSGWLTADEAFFAAFSYTRSPARTR